MFFAVESGASELGVSILMTTGVKDDEVKVEVGALFGFASSDVETTFCEAEGELAVDETASGESSPFFEVFTAIEVGRS